jgi:hypothetical protein
MSSETLPIKGQETKMSLISPSGLEESVTKVKESSWTFDMEILTEQYLSETADQFDDIFRGCSVELTFDLTDPKVYAMVQAIIDRAQRRTPATGTFSVISTLNFPTGKKLRLLFSNLRFGEIPTSFGGRDEYGEVKLTAKCSGYRKL